MTMTTINTTHCAQAIAGALDIPWREGAGDIQGDGWQFRATPEREEELFFLARDVGAHDGIVCTVLRDGVIYLGRGGGTIGLPERIWIAPDLRSPGSLWRNTHLRADRLSAATLSRMQAVLRSLHDLHPGAALASEWLQEAAQGPQMTHPADWIDARGA